MKIFGINFTTKKELKNTIFDLECDIAELNYELDIMQETFPFDMGEVVYDVALKNAQGRYTKIKPSFEHSTITEVVVDEKNYFNLAKRLKCNDVFFSREDAEEYLKTVCK
jgi:light-regulated signal transduction histidine kinase (bacteriophytochrome)